MATRPLTVTLPEELIDALRHAARADGRSVSNYLAHVLVERVPLLDKGGTLDSPSRMRPGRKD